MLSLDENFDNLSIINSATNEKLLEIEIPEGQDKLIKKLKEVFPEESKAIDEYVEISFPPKYEIIPVIILKCFPFIFSKLFKYLVAPKFMNYVHTSIGQALDKLTSNQLLKSAICYIGIDYGSNPKATPLYEHSMIHNIFKNGGHIPKEGADDIVESLIKVIRKGGGDVMSKANVASIHINKEGKCGGVCVLKNKDSIIIESPIVISSAGVYNTYSKLIPRPIREKLGYNHFKYTPSYSVQATFLGYDGTIEELGLKFQNYFIMTNPDFDGQFTRYMESDGDIDPKNGIDIPILIANLRPYNNKVSMTILSFANHAWFQEWNHQRVGQRSVDYEDLKERIANRALELLYMKHPQLENRHSVMSTSSPITFNHYLSNNFGDYMGFKRVVGNDDGVFRWGRPMSNLENLFLVGQDIFAGGVQGAMLSALITCGCVLRRNLFDDLAKAVEEMKKWKALLFCFK
ncbi:predicted protein [Naegleria gruberi]|uniref:Predicted protein n=1 Tax=Naegleria gruberi TaxID=5762 RepID=D2VZ45_NAEGR|nr:uncharacterized protein NAEGRDRAFT_81787 [Naegleria gruberi]EFC37878.1 predicted protein [Naegleria gruberi]|eukprot:XP_002670622.1 predicted protein [Naegleria gruberi strain NEG-M]